MTRATVLLFMLLLAACSDEKPPTQAIYEMIESPLQNTVISSSDTYPPKPVLSCEPETRSTLTITDGKISASESDVTGSIGREGAGKVSIGGAYADSQLNGNAGSGRWNSASGRIPCSGRWEASRQ
jgi:hypothetical protein